MCQCPDESTIAKTWPKGIPTAGIDRGWLNARNVGRERFECELCTDARDLERIRRLLEVPQRQARAGVLADDLVRLDLTTRKEPEPAIRWRDEAPLLKAVRGVREQASRARCEGALDRARYDATRCRRAHTLGLRPIFRKHSSLWHGGPQRTSRGVGTGHRQRVEPPEGLFQKWQ